MRYYPINLDVRNRHCLVVGGGKVGERKVKGLLRSGARVAVVTLQATDTLKTMASDRLIDLELRRYSPSDLDGKLLVIGATDDGQINNEISRDAMAKGILCNIVDRPEACTFVLPAVAQQGDLIIAVSTSNKSPALAGRLRKRLEKEFGPEYATLLKLMGAVRNRLLEQSGSLENNKDKFERLLDLGLVELIRDNRKEEVDAGLKDVMGEGFTWTALMQDEQGTGLPGSVRPKCRGDE
jgi:precorrin-2 dehydrogenase/sirohydrochlorin ferrochelatase